MRSLADSERIRRFMTALGRRTRQPARVYFTGGASAVLLMSEERAATLGYQPLAYIRSYAYAALDPGEQLLMGPVLAAPVALQRAGLSLQDIDLIEMHEAFAAQILCNLKGFESREWAARAGFNEPVGEVDRSRLNVMGGSI